MWMHANTKGWFYTKLKANRSEDLSGELIMASTNADCCECWQRPFDSGFQKALALPLHPCWKQARMYYDGGGAAGGYGSSHQCSTNAEGKSCYLLPDVTWPFPK